MQNSPHQDLPMLELGDPLSDVKRIVILLHGRGATADSMADLARSLYTRGSRFYLPQAAQNRWYPQTAFGPLAANQPYLDSALRVIDDLILDLGQKGFQKDQIVLGGFSQGACLAAEYLVRNPARFGGLLVFSGALIGPPDEKRNPPGDLEGMPVFIGGSDQDPWIQKELLLEAERVFSSMGAEVVMQIYPGVGHIITDDQIQRARNLIEAVRTDAG